MGRDGIVLELKSITNSILHLAIHSNSYIHLLPVRTELQKNLAF